MNAQLQLWMPVFLGLISTLIAIVFTAWLNTRAVIAYVDALRSEMKQGFSEQRLEFHQELSGMRLELHKELSQMNLRIEHIDHSIDRLETRTQRLEESRGLVRP